jgi:hypothetical protein
MFEDESIHIRDVQSAIRPGLCHYRSEPGIAADEEFAILLVRPRAGS